MKSNIPLIALGVCLVLTAMVMLRMAFPKESEKVPTTEPYTIILTDIVGKNPTYSYPTQPGTNLFTVSSSEQDGVLIISTRRELQYKLSKIASGDSAEQLKAIFGIYPEVIYDGNGEITGYRYYCSTVTITVRGENASSVSAIETDTIKNEQTIIFQADFN